MDTPSAQLLAAANARINVVDALGRTIEFRRPTALDRLRLFKAVGPELAENDRYLGLAMMAACVTAIDTIPVPPPITEHQIEALIQRLDDPGLTAIGLALAPGDEGREPAVATPGNAPMPPLPSA